MRRWGGEWPPYIDFPRGCQEISVGENTMGEGMVFGFRA